MNEITLNKEEINKEWLETRKVKTMEFPEATLTVYFDPYDVEWTPKEEDAFKGFIFCKIREFLR